jgi:hypothetical protein
MKTRFLLLIFTLFSFNLFAQNEKTKFFVETGLKAFGGGDFLNFIGKTGFSYNKSKWQTYNNDGSLWQESTYDGFSLAIAPRVGYCVNNRFKTGIDFQYYHSKLSYGIKYRNFTSGLFLRFDFNDKKITPFVELSSGAGLSKNVEDRTSPGGADYKSIEKLKLFYYSGSVGLSFTISANFNLNVSARIQNTLGNEIQNNDDSSVSYITEKTRNLEIGTMLSIAYIFNKKNYSK